MVALTCRARASATPWAMIRCTSEVARKVVASAQLPVHSVPAGAELVPAALCAAPPPEHAAAPISAARVHAPLAIAIVLWCPVAARLVDGVIGVATHAAHRDVVGLGPIP